MFRGPRQVTHNFCGDASQIATTFYLGHILCQQKDSQPACDSNVCGTISIIESTPLPPPHLLALSLIVKGPGKPPENLILLSNIWQPDSESSSLRNFFRRLEKVLKRSYEGEVQTRLYFKHCSVCLTSKVENLNNRKHSRQSRQPFGKSRVSIKVNTTTETVYKHTQTRRQRDALPPGMNKFQMIPTPYL